MAEFDANDFDDTLEFFILTGFSDGPLSVSEIRQRMKWAERLLYLAARRKGKRNHASVSEALDRLQHDGCLKIERLGEQQVYSLTAEEQQRLQVERGHRKSILAQFVEDAELDTSLRFLDSKSARWPN